MSTVNRVILVGRLGHDPQMRDTQQGGKVCNFSLATDHKPKDGDKVTEWHNVTLFGKQAELAGEWLHKGDTCYVEGRIHYEKYQGKDGTEKLAVKILADRFAPINTQERQAQQTAPVAATTAHDDQDLPF